ncbi:hypothetical protein BO86DRAFT_387689 [Aspergillus japonicus CBS 114.51]|uniref:Uncharacterized protein n=1 Tax=Aspergillus japonicus CBS 114.51 TaxID=1448312 RepID=A0A8T8X6T9_ASPJA|nr:hypothetical protein BO86DRAFT_387689 [Aspergillus japonicus CBS 114.51]RAH83858.1 hypothetical protein BO86DRAFT_387689 [Aspergillus japonicus CBS 114.51]
MACVLHALVIRLTFPVENTCRFLVCFAADHVSVKKEATGEATGGEGLLAAGLTAVTCVVRLQNCLLADGLRQEG